MVMWIARHCTGALFLFSKRPERVAEDGKCHWMVIDDDFNRCYLELPRELFPELTCEDEPVQIDLTDLVDSNLVWDEKILFHLKKVLKIADTYSNPLCNDAVGSMECHDICDAIKPICKRLESEIERERRLRKTELYKTLTFDEAVESLVSLLNTPIGRRKNGKYINDLLDEFRTVEKTDRSYDMCLKQLVLDVLNEVYAANNVAPIWNETWDIKTCIYVIMDKFNNDVDRRPYSKLLERLENDLKKTTIKTL